MDVPSIVGYGFVAAGLLIVSFLAICSVFQLVRELPNRFSLGALFVAMTAVAVVLGLIGYTVR